MIDDIYDELEIFITKMNEIDVQKGQNWANLIKIWKNKAISQENLLEEISELFSSTSDNSNKNLMINFAINVWCENKKNNYLDVIEKMRLTEILLFRLQNFVFEKALSEESDFYVKFFTTMVEMKGFIENNLKNKESVHVDFVKVSEAQETIVPNLLLLDLLKVSVDKNKNKENNELDAFISVVKNMIDSSLKYDMDKFDENMQHQYVVSYELDLINDMKRLTDVVINDKMTEMIDSIRKYLLDMDNVFNQYKIKNRIVSSNYLDNFYVDVSELTDVKHSYSFSAGSYMLVSGQGFRGLRLFSSQIGYLLNAHNKEKMGLGDCELMSVENEGAQDKLIENDFKDVFVLKTGSIETNKKVKKILMRILDLNMKKEKNVIVIEELLIAEERERNLREEMEKIAPLKISEGKKKI